MRVSRTDICVCQQKICACQQSAPKDAACVRLDMIDLRMLLASMVAS